MSDRSIHIEPSEDSNPVLVIPVDVAWQDFTFHNGEFRIEVPPASWEAVNIGPKP
jgi:hypothetical protein